MNSNRVLQNAISFTIPHTKTILPPQSLLKEIENRKSESLISPYRGKVNMTTTG